MSRHGKAKATLHQNPLEKHHYYSTCFCTRFQDSDICELYIVKPASQKKISLDYITVLKEEVLFFPLQFLELLGGVCSHKRNSYMRQIKLVCST